MYLSLSSYTLLNYIICFVTVRDEMIIFLYNNNKTRDDTAHNYLERQACARQESSIYNIMCRAYMFFF